jgi:hypothetical protein
MVEPRDGHSAVRLLDGRVLIVGGTEGSSGPELTSAELYDPATGTWTATGDMLRRPDGFSPTLLRDGRVLVGDVDHLGADDLVHGAEVYDPASGTWTATAKMVKRADFPSDTAGWDTATLLGDGKVLLAEYRGAAQLYDPASRTWTATGKMITPRLGPTATLLSDGRVLVAGGQVWPGDWTQAAEIYDPVTGSWTEIADMQSGNPGGTLGIATQLPDGKGLVYSRMGSEVYDPATGTWTARTMPTKFLPDPRALLSDGTVLTGDCDAALYDPRIGSLTTASSMLRCDDAGSHSFTPLLDGTVLVAGGRACDQGGVTAGSGGSTCVSTGATELYVPAGVSLPPFSFPSPPPPVFPSPTPEPPLLPPAAGPVPPNARSWTVTVENDSSEPATMFVAEGEEGVLRLVGSATPNVVPAGTTMRVTFLFPAKGPDDGWITVNPRMGEGADVGSVGADNIGMPGKIWITAECEGCWVGPAQ